MKIKMLEYFQGTGQPTLTPGNEYDSTAIGNPLAVWLVEHRKAVDVTPPAPKPEPEPEKVEEIELPEKPAPRARTTKRGSKKDESD